MFILKPLCFVLIQPAHWTEDSSSPITALVSRLEGSFLKHSEGVMVVPTSPSLISSELRGRVSFSARPGPCPHSPPRRVLCYARYFHLIIPPFSCVGQSASGFRDDYHVRCLVFVTVVFPISASMDTLSDILIFFFGFCGNYSFVFIKGIGQGRKREERTNCRSFGPKKQVFHLRKTKSRRSSPEY